MRKFIRRLLMLHPGYRKAHFVGLEVQELRRELVGLLEGNEARVKEAIVAAKPADRTDELKAEIRNDLSATSDNLAKHVDGAASGLAATLSEKVDAVGASVHGDLSATSDNFAKHVNGAASGLAAMLSEKVDAVGAAVHGDLAKQMETISERELKAIKDSCETLFRNDIRCRWQVVDALDPLLFPRTTKVKCPICGHTAPRDAYETKVTECIFGGGRLERYVCPDCGAIFGPLKMMALIGSRLGEEYRQSYSVYSESDCTMLEKRAFEALHPRKDGVYLNYGAGAWNRTTRELREAGYEVYDYEPYAPKAADPWVIRDPVELRKRKFDGIFSNDLIEHLTDPIRDLEDMKRLLKPGGEMVHCSGCYEYAFEYTRFHLFFFTGDSLRRVADAIGLEYELGDRLFDYSPARLCRFFRRADK